MSDMEWKRPLLDALEEHRGDWPAQKALILAHEFVTPSPAPPDPVGDWTATPGSWDDVTDAAFSGFITWPQYEEVGRLVQIEE